MGEGIGVGLEDAMAEVARDMQHAIPTNLDLNYSSQARQGGVSPGGTTITQNLSVVTPKALSEKELVMEFKNLSQKLSMSY